MNACILVTGAQGQVGHALMGQAPEHLQVTGLASTELDIRDHWSLSSASPACSRA